MKSRMQLSHQRRTCDEWYYEEYFSAFCVTNWRDNKQKRRAGYKMDSKLVYSVHQHNMLIVGESKPKSQLAK